jgi:hypothetical protein
MWGGGDRVIKIYYFSINLDLYLMVGSSHLTFKFTINIQNTDFLLYILCQCLILVETNVVPF